MQQDKIVVYGPEEAEYKTACQFPGCKGQGREWRIPTEGWRPGMMVQEDPTDPTIGRCPRCKRYSMMVVRAPDLPPPKGPEGFWRLPTK